MNSSRHPPPSTRKPPAYRHRSNQDGSKSRVWWARTFGLSDLGTRTGLPRFGTWRLSVFVYVFPAHSSPPTIDTLHRPHRPHRHDQRSDIIDNELACGDSGRPSYFRKPPGTANTNTAVSPPPSLKFLTNSTCVGDSHPSHHLSSLSGHVFPRHIFHVSVNGYVLFFFWCGVSGSLTCVACSVSRRTIAQSAHDFYRCGVVCLPAMAKNAGQRILISFVSQVFVYGGNVCRENPPAIPQSRPPNLAILPVPPWYSHGKSVHGCRTHTLRWLPWTSLPIWSFWCLSGVRPSTDVLIPPPISTPAVKPDEDTEGGPLGKRGWGGWLGGTWETEPGGFGDAGGHSPATERIHEWPENPGFHPQPALPTATFENRRLPASTRQPSPAGFSRLGAWLPGTDDGRFLPMAER